MTRRREGSDFIATNCVDPWHPSRCCTALNTGGQPCGDGSFEYPASFSSASCSWPHRRWLVRISRCTSVSPVCTWDTDPATIRDTPIIRHTHTRHPPTTTRDMATIRDMRTRDTCIRIMDTASAITGEADDMFGRRTTEVGADVAGTGPAAICIASWLTDQVASRP